MGRFVISQNVSLDGVMQDPTGEEGFRHGGWFDLIEGSDRGEWANLALDEALGASALLFGRRSFEFFAALWPSRDGDLADRLNGMPKYVVTSGWRGSVVGPRTCIWRCMPRMGGNGWCETADN